MNIVLDASAGLIIAAANTHAHLRELLGAAKWVGAPELYDFEVTNTVWKYNRFGDWTAEQSESVLGRALELIDQRVDGASLAVEALALARQHSHSAYDMFYIALARRRDALLATLDAKMTALAQRVGVRVDGGLAAP